MDPVCIFSTQGSCWLSRNHTCGSRGCGNGLGRAITLNVRPSFAATGRMQTESNSLCVNTPARRRISSGPQIRSSPAEDIWNNFLSACTADSASALRSHTDRSLLQHGPGMKIPSAWLLQRTGVLLLCCCCCCCCCGPLCSNGSLAQKCLVRLST